MKQIVEHALQQALDDLKQAGMIPRTVTTKVNVEHSKEKTHGDYASNIALILAKPSGKSPKQLAELLVKAIKSHDFIDHIEIAGPGFINFFMKSSERAQIIASALHQGEQFGHTNLGLGQKVLIEYVSANPTGPLHVGHGRGAAFGASLANLLSVAGYQVSREYYVNDAGRQMSILAASVWLRYLAGLGEPIQFPANGYQGDYVNDIAKTVLEQYKNKFLHTWHVISDTLPPDECQGGDKEHYIDALIRRMQHLLGEEGYRCFHQRALDAVLTDIKADLDAFGVPYDCWFSEQSLLDSGAIDQGIQALKQAGHTYEQGGALWFKASALGDEKDRVLIRANGQSTYFASDVAYHWNKYQRGFTRVIDIFGADHHGYISRVRAAVNALGHDDQALNVLLVQFAILYRRGERVQMSTRSGSYVTLRELREEVGNDAARFFYLIRKPDQHMDFDLDLAKSQSNDNPVYYIQYAHARISSVLQQLKTRNLSWDERKGVAHIGLLKQPHELTLITLISRYPDVIALAASACEPHQVAYYLRELANGLHSYYNAVTLLCEQESLRCARLCLLKAVKQVLCNGMQLLGVCAPESM